MQLALNAWTFPARMPLEERIAAVAAAGFDAIELTADEGGPLDFDTPDAALAAWRGRCEAAGVAIASLASGAFWQASYADADPAGRRLATERTRRMLQMAEVLGTDAILVVPAVVGRAGDARPRVAYADALHRVLDTLRALRHEAEDRGVTIALENVWNRFLLSPLEAAELIERVNSPRVGWYLDVGNLMPFGYAADWIAALGGRIARVHVKDYDLARSGSAGFCPLGEGSVDWPAVVASLRRSGYYGPLTYEGPGEPADILRRLRRLLAAPAAVQEPDHEG